MPQAFNRTRNTSLATDVVLASTHWSRFRGLMATRPESFAPGKALLLSPSRGIHTFAMRFPIDALYLDHNGCVIHLEESLRPWRLAPIKLAAVKVLELPAGTIHESATEVGDVIEISDEACRPLPRKTP